MDVQYTKGGTPVILVPDDILQGSGLCSVAGEAATSNISNGGRWGADVPLVLVLSVTFLGVLLLS